MTARAKEGVKGRAEHEGLGTGCTVFLWTRTDISREQNVVFRPNLDMKLTFLPSERLLCGQEALRNFDGTGLRKFYTLQKDEKTVSTCKGQGPDTPVHSIGSSLMLN